MVPRCVLADADRLEQFQLLGRTRGLFTDFTSWQDPTGWLWAVRTWQGHAFALTWAGRNTGHQSTKTRSGNHHAALTNPPQTSSAALLFPAAAVANDGVTLTPYLVNRIFDADGNTVETFEPSPMGQAMDPATASVLTEMM